MVLEKKVEVLFRELNFEKVSVNGTELFLQGGIYYKISFVKGLKSYIIEFANSNYDAVNNVFEDGDLYPTSMDEDELIDNLRQDLINYYIR